MKQNKGDVAKNATGTNHSSTLVITDPFPGTRMIQNLCMLREELDYYILKSTDDDDGESNSKNSLFRKMKRMPSVNSSRKSLEIPENNLSQYQPQIRQVCQNYFKSLKKVVILPSSPHDTFEPPVLSSVPRLTRF